MSYNHGTTVEPPSTPDNNSVAPSVQKSEAWRFGGPCLDLDRDAGHAWGAAYEVEESGEVSHWQDTSFLRIRQTFPDHEIPLEQAKDLAFLVGRASACIYYKENYTLSGFFIDEKTFLTCAHFVPFEMRNRAEKMKAIERQDNGSVVIAPNRKPLQLNPSNLKAHLIFESVESDYAVFQLDDGQPPRKSDWVLGKDSVQSLSPKMAQSLDQHRVFTVGYNSDGLKKEWNEFVDKSKELLSSPQRSNLDALHHGGLNQTPDMDILKPGRRSIALGRFQGGKLSKMPPHRYLHTISGWYGISGSPIALFESREGLPAKLVILGLFTGGFDKEVGNHMAHFSADEVENIRSYCA